METIDIPILAIVIALLILVIITENLFNWGFRKVNETNDEGLVFGIIILYMIRTALIVVPLVQILK